MAATRLIPMHQNKGKSIQQTIKDRVDYAENGEKTNDKELVSSYACNPDMVDGMFADSKRLYYQKTQRVIKGDILAYQIRQSFKPGEVTPEEANRIGYETAMRWTKGNHAFIVATHVDRAHVHNHIIYNSTNLDCDRKFKNFFLSSFVLQKISDLVCLEHGLSIIKPRKPSEQSKRTEYPKRKSIREQIREDIDFCLGKNPKSFEELLRYLEQMGYEVKRGKHTAIRRDVQERFVRFRSLGEGYREEDLEAVFKGETKPNQKLDMLLDIQAMIAKGKGPGYERWAKVHNVKQMAQTLLFLEEHDLRDYEKLVEKAKAASDRFGEITKRQKELEERLVQIATLKKHIINYSKTHDVYAEYKRSGYSKKFFEDHREEITLHKAAKDAFSKMDGPIPKIRELNEEYERILSEKKKTYTEYRQAKEDMKDYQTAKYNVDQFLRREEEENRERQKQKENKVL